MDFDPSAFLSMDMTEDQNAVYTAPDVPQGFSPLKIPPGKIVVEGGLQMEQDMQIPVPVFGLLQESENDVEEATEEVRLDDPIHVDTGEHESNSTPQASPVEKSMSPSHKKVIHATFEETKFRKDLFAGHYERVKMFRLHCSICDRHLGCAPWFTERQMRMHKLLSVVVCRKCFEFYGDINFPIEEDSELYCCWCGEGGECFCCSTCPKIVCKKCVKRNFGAAKLKEIENNDDWSCFVCQPEDIWPHRALMWGLQRWGRGLRQLVAMLPKEEKQTKLSMDTSHCCLKEIANEKTLVGLPPKNVLSKIPSIMIASAYQNYVIQTLARPDKYLGPSNGVLPPNNLITYSPDNVPSRATQTATHVPMNRETIQSHRQVPVAQHHSQPPRPIVMQQLARAVINHEQRNPRAMQGYHVRETVHRNMVVMNRSAPYPVPPMLPPPRFAQSVQYPPRPPPLAYSEHPSPSRMNPSMHTASYQQPRPGDFRNQFSSSSKPPLFDLSDLQSTVVDVKNFLHPTMIMVDQFDSVKNNLANDFSKLTNYMERLSHNIKMLICNLAKSNTDLLEYQKKFIDNRVSSVVSDINLSISNNIPPPIVNGFSSPINQIRNESRTKGSGAQMIVDSSPEIVEVTSDSPSKTPERNHSNAEHVTPATPLSSTGEEVEDLTIAMLCEAVLEVGENKGNNVANKDQAAKDKSSQQVINKSRPRGRPKSVISRKRPLDKSESPEIHVINLSDEEEEKNKFDDSFWCKKFKIAPCKIVVKKLRT